MDIASLDIKLIRQRPGSDDCLRACGLMAFKYYNDQITKIFLWNKLHVYKKHSGLIGSYVQDLGIITLKRGYKSVIAHNDWQWWTQDVVDQVQKGPKGLKSSLSTLEKEKKEWSDKKIIKKEIKFSELGGKLKFEIPKLSTLDRLLISKIPIIIIVSSDDFYHQPIKGYCHTILIQGKTGDNYHILDPLYATSKISSDELLYAWSRAGGWRISFIPKVRDNNAQVKLNF